VSHGHSKSWQLSRHSSARLSHLPILPATADSTSQTLAGGLDQPRPRSVSPISQSSETRASTLAHQCSDTTDKHHQETHHLGEDNPSPIQSPVDKHQSTWDLFASTPLFAEEVFHPSSPANRASDSSPSPSPATPPSAPPSSALPSPALHDAGHLSADDRSDGWVEITTRHSSGPGLAGSIGKPDRKMTVPPATDRQAVRHESEPPAPARQTSFVGLPPIRRLSTFGLSGNKGHHDQGDGDWGLSSVLHPDQQPSAGSTMSSAMLQHPGNEQMAAGQPQFSQMHTLGDAQPAPQHFGQGHSNNGQSPYSPSQQPGSNGYTVGQNGNPPVYPQSFGPGPQQVAMGRGGGTPIDLPHPPYAQRQTGSPPAQWPPFMPPGARGQATPPLGANPVSRAPPEGQWKLEESHLSQPLHSARNRASSSNSPPVPGWPGNYAFDKETAVEEPTPDPKPVMGPQRLPRNNGTPPVSAQRFPGLFPTGVSNQMQSPSPQDEIQPDFPPHDSLGISRSSTQDFDEPGNRGSGIFKEIGGKIFHRERRGSSASLHRDDVSVSSAPGQGEHRDRKKRRSLLGFSGHITNNDVQSQPQQPDAEPSQQHHQDGPGGRKMSLFKVGTFSRHKDDVTFSPSDTSSVANEPPHSTRSHTPEPPQLKKRFSELKSLFKNMPKDDQQPPSAGIDLSSAPVPERSQANPTNPANSGNPSTQGPPQQQSQDAQRRPSQIEPSGVTTTQNETGQPTRQGIAPQMWIARSSTQGASQLPLRTQSPAGGHPPLNKTSSMVDTQHDQHIRKASGGFLGGLFGSRPSSRSREPMPQHGQSMPPGQSHGQARVHPDHQAHPAQFPVKAHQLGPRPDMTQTGQPLQRPVVQQGAMMPGPLPLQGTPQPTQPSIAPEQTLTGSGQGGPQSMPSPSQTGPPVAQNSTGDPQSRAPLITQPGSQMTVRPPNVHPLSSNPVHPRSVSGDQPRLVPAGSSEPSLRSSQERLSVSGSSLAPRVSPARKPVGSGISRPERRSVSSTQTGPAPQQSVSSTPIPDRKLTEEPGATGVSNQSERRGPSPSPSAQKSPLLKTPAPSNDTQQASLPSPSRSATSPELSPDMSDQQRFSGQSVTSSTSAGPLISPHSPTPSGMMTPNRHVPEKFSQAQEQPKQFGKQTSPPRVGVPGPGITSPGPKAQQPPFTTPFVGRNPETGVSIPGQSGPQHLPPHVQGHRQPQGQPQPQPQPTHTDDYLKGRMSRLFGGNKKKEAASTHGANAQTPQKGKDKESSSNRLLHAFKRSSKQPNSASPHPGQSPRQGPPPPMSAGRGQMPAQHMPPQMMMQGGRGWMPGQPGPQGVYGPAPNQPQFAMPGWQGQGRGQMQPPPMQGGRGQLPPNMMPMAQGGWGGPVAPQQQPIRADQQFGGAQYGPGPLPQGYNPVRGHPGPDIIAPTPQYAGRGMPMPMPMPHEQNPRPVMQQPRSPPQQFDSRMNLPSQGYNQYGQPLSPTQQQLGVPPHMIQSPQPQRVPQPAYAQRDMAQQPQSPPQPDAMVNPSAVPGAHPQSQAGRQAASASPLSQGSSEGGPVARPRQPLGPVSQFIGVLPSQGNEIEQKPSPQPIVTTMSQEGQPRVQHPGSPQSYPLPDSAATMSPINPNAAMLRNPPLPPAEGLDSRHTMNENIQRSVSNVSYTPSPPRGPPVGVVSANGDAALPQKASRNSSLSPDAPVERTFSVSPEPSGQTPSPSHGAPDSEVGEVGKRASDAEDIYDVSPRKLQAPKIDVQPPPAPQTSNAEVVPTADGSRDVAVTGAGAGGVMMVSATTAGTAANNSHYSSDSEGQSSLVQPTPREPEEKILVDQPAELSAVNDDDDNLMMSATSYPGQEWNPYAAGEFGYYED
jgi:hypothetical protein